MAAVLAPLTAVVVHRRRPQRCLATLAALRRQGRPTRTLVVDNGSPPADLRMLRSAAPDTEILELGANRGYGPAANAGLRRWLAAGEGEWAVVAPDDAVAEAGCIATLLGAVAERPQAGVVSAEFGPGHEYAPTVDRILGPYLRAVPRRRGFEPADFGHGTLLGLRRRCLEEVGLFDEAYFAYCEEADLGLRARARGWEVGFVWGAVVRNSDPSDTDLRAYLELRNTLRLVEKHFGAPAAAARLRLARASWLTNAVRRRGRRAAALRRAIADYRAGRFGSPPEVMMRG